MSQDSKNFTLTFYVILGTTQQLGHKCLLGTHCGPSSGRVGGVKAALPTGNFNLSLGPVRVTEHVHSPPSHSKSKLNESRAGGGGADQN